MGYNWATKEMENNKETQSRREFFKEAARKALPILGAVVLISNPVIAKTVEKEISGCEDCWGNCDGSCYSTCKGTCEGSCLKGCKTSCYGTCDSTCTAGCGKSSK